MTNETNFGWAVNKIKLAQAVLALRKAKELNPQIELNEQTILAEYKRRAGFVVGAPETAANVVTAKPITKLTLTELNDLAVAKGVDVTGLTKKAEFIAALTTAGITEVAL